MLNATKPVTLYIQCAFCFAFGVCLQENLQVNVCCAVWFYFFCNLFMFWSSQWTLTTSRDC